jgi:hypothetical protein
MATREENEKTFTNWVDNSDGTRTYWYNVKGKHGWYARYVKIVNTSETTLNYRQEIYDYTGKLIEIHDKYPVDKGHRKLESDKLWLPKYQSSIN